MQSGQGWHLLLIDLVWGFHPNGYDHDLVSRLLVFPLLVLHHPVSHHPA